MQCTVRRVLGLCVLIRGGETGEEGEGGRSESGTVLALVDGLGWMG
jgi:hypothetical protein